MSAEKAERKAKKPPKPAAVYRKPIPEKTFKKKYLGLVEQEKDRILLETSFDSADGLYVLKTGLDRPTLVRLNKLAKEIRKNRGSVQAGPLVLALILVSGIAVFVAIFMNPLLERSIERALESSFGARSEVTKFRFRPWNLEVSMRSITVADRERPMKNLFQTGRVEFRMNPSYLIRGRFYIEEASVADIAMGTPRKTSGALDEKKEDEPTEAPTAPAAPSVAAAASSLVNLENFDAAALLEREKDKLTVGAAYEAAGAAYDAAVARWEDRVGASKKSVSDLGASAKSVLAINPKQFRSLEDVQKAVAEAKAVAEKAKAAADEAKSVADGVKSDADAAAALVKTARSAVDADLAYLTSFIDPKSGAAKGVLEPVIRSLLDDKVQTYVYYGKRGLEVVNKLKAGNAAAAAEKKRVAAASRGRDVVFPSAALPRFRLGLLASSFAAGDQDWAIELREVTSDPDLVKDATTLKIRMERGSSAASADVIADMRSSSPTAFSVRAASTRLPVDLGNALSPVGLGGFTGRADASLELHGEKSGDIAADAEIDIRESAASDAKGAVGKAIAEALASVDAVELTVGYEKPKGKEADFSLDTNLDKIIAKAVRDLADKYAKEAAAELERALREYVAKELEGEYLSKEQLDQLFAAAKGDQAAAAALRSSVEKKRAELEGRAKAIVDETAAKAKAEAKRAADQAAKKAKDAAADALKKVDKPKIGF